MALLGILFEFVMKLMKSKNIFFMGYLIASAVFAEDIGVPVEPINVGSRAAMPSEGESLALLPFAEDVPPVRDAMPSEVSKSAAGGDVRGDRMGMQINRALLARDWAALKRLLAQYAEQPQYDAVLYRYALGALYRSEMRQGEAADLYRELLSERPDLVYPRFDLGVMLFEDKQYREALVQLHRVEEALPPDMRQLAREYIRQAEAVQAWHPSFNMNYEQTDNVNNASPSRDIVLNGRKWTKSEDSLPKRANGIRYELGIDRMFNIAGNHFARLGISGSGVHYWNARDFSEQAFHAEAGYRYRNSRLEWGFRPFVEQNWLGNNRYTANTGIALDYSRRLNEKWRSTQSLQYGRKQYHNEYLAKRYNSKTISVSSTFGYYAMPSWQLYGGISGMFDNTVEKEQASRRYGVSLGTVKILDGGLGLKLGAGYTKRIFKAPATLIYNFTRRDDEYRMSAALWHKKLSWKGFTPQINFRYNKINSNMPAFYSRSGKEWFISIEKTY